MLTCAGIGVAVANAPDQVKQQADIVINSNEEDGVSRFLERYLLENIYSHA